MPIKNYFLCHAYRADFSILVFMGSDFTVKDGEVYLNNKNDVEQYLARTATEETSNTCESIGCVSESYNIVAGKLECMSCGTVQQ